MATALMPRLVSVPVSDAVAEFIYRGLPDEIQVARRDARESAYTVSVCRSLMNREAREIALSDLAAANKVLGKYNPGLIVRPGGWSR